MEYEKLSDDRLGKPSAAIQARVEAARQQQRERFSVGAGGVVGAKQPHPEANPTLNGASPLSQIQSNADMRPAEVRQFCALDETCRALMRR